MRFCASCQLDASCGETRANGETKRRTEQVKIIYKSNLAEMESLGVRGTA